MLINHPKIKTNNLNTFVLYFNQCKEDLGPQKKLLMVFHPPHWLTYYNLFFSLKQRSIELKGFCFTHYSIEH